MNEFKAKKCLRLCEQYFSSNQAPAILNSIFFFFHFENNTIYSYSLLLRKKMLESRTYVKRTLSFYAASGGSRDNFFFLDLFHSLVKTLTMRDNELKSISSSLSNTHQKKVSLTLHSILSSKKRRDIKFLFLF